MSGNGAYDDEMAFLNRPTPEDRELAAFAESMRAALVAPPSPAQQAALVPRLAEAARIARAEAPTAVAAPARGRRHRLRLAAQVAFAVALLPLVSAGLAVAGVKLPGPAQSAFERVGVDLPNQTDSSGDRPTSEPTSEPGPGEVDAGAGGAIGGDDPATSPGKAAPKDSGRGDDDREAKGKPAHSGGPSHAPADNGTSKSQGRGKSGQAPGHTGSAGNAGGNGKANAVGKTDSTPPGQANQPVSPGNSGSANGKSK